MNGKTVNTMSSGLRGVIYIKSADERSGTTDMYEILDPPKGVPRASPYKSSQNIRPEESRLRVEQANLKASLVKKTVRWREEPPKPSRITMSRKDPGSIIIDQVQDVPKNTVLMVRWSTSAYSGARTFDYSAIGIEIATEYCADLKRVWQNDPAFGVRMMYQDREGNVINPVRTVDAMNSRIYCE